MIRAKKRIFFLFSVFVVSLLCAGCFQASEEITIYSDGSVNVQGSVDGLPIAKKSIDDAKKIIEGSHQNAFIRNSTNAQKPGFYTEMKYPSIEAMAKNEGNIFKTVEGLGKGVQLHRGWFFDICAFDLYVKGSPKAGAIPMPQKGEFTLKMHLPTDYLATNADEASDDMRTVSWDLSDAVTKGDAKSVQVSFKIWHKDRFIMTMAAIGVLIVLAGIGILLAYYYETGTMKKISVMFTMMSILIIIIIGASTYYILKTPVELTDEDIISPTVEASVLNVLK